MATQVKVCTRCRYEATEKSACPCRLFLAQVGRLDTRDMGTSVHPRVSPPYGEVR